MTVSAPLFPFSQYGERIAVIDGDSGSTVLYRDIPFFELSSQRSLVFLFCQNTPDDVLAYASLINQGHVVALLDQKLGPELKQKLISIYKPDYILSAHLGKEEEYVQKECPFPSLQLWSTNRPDRTPHLNPELKLLLSTSGTTGSPKMVRLSAKNIVSNAQAIVEYLGITYSDIAAASLPMHYSYGLSVIHSHFMAGAAVVLTQSSIVQENFWTVFKKFRCTSFAGVPYMYEILDRMRFEDLSLPSLLIMTQAGGRLDPVLADKFDSCMKRKGGRFFVMYGQTEATARMAFVPPERLPEKRGSIGCAIPGGRLQVYENDVPVHEPGVIGELVYQGPNVMLGYAEKGNDLSLGDSLDGTLRTGDLGYFDSDGFFYLTGRMKRISKVYGYRFNLDELEELLLPIARVAAASDDKQIVIYLETVNSDRGEECVKWLSDRFKLHRETFTCRYVDKFPLTSSGKIDYQSLYKDKVEKNVSSSF